MNTRVSVAGIALREQGKTPAEVFAARRLPGGDVGGKWEFPGGKVRDGETGEEALIREWAEELSVAVKPLSLIGEAVFIHGGTEFTLRAYGIVFLSGKPGEDSPPVQPGDLPAGFVLSVHSAWRWAAVDDLEAMDFAGSDRLLFPAVRRALM
ncbi:MAG: NUDIX domain-containing protein [Treponema sp.]|nr:NUDIX domain-containing protein [Treponema sp.]